MTRARARRAALAGRIALAGLAALLVVPEAALYLASAPADVPQARGHCRVLVLGFPPGADGKPGAVQRYRVRVAAETARRYECRTVVLSGGNPRSARPEAEDLAELARAEGLGDRRLVLERTSRTTWENVADSLPALSGPDHVFIASDPAHAWRARGYLCRQSPALCARTHVAAAYRPFELFWYQWASALWTLKSAARDRLRLAMGEPEGL